MTDLEQAHMAGFMEGVDLAQEIARKHLTLAAVIEIAKEEDWNSRLFKRIEDEIALAVSHRMEAE